MGNKLEGVNKIDTLAIFSARYSHKRKTGASFAVIQALKAEFWDMMSLDGKRQLLEETRESYWCKDDWDEFCEWAKNKMN